MYSKLSTCVAQQFPSDWWWCVAAHHHICQHGWAELHTSSRFQYIFTPCIYLTIITVLEAPLNLSALYLHSKIK